MAKLGPGQGLGREAAEGSLVPSQKREYKPCGKHTEGKHPLYAIEFNFMDARYYDVFSTVGGNRVTTYRCLENGSFALLQAYVDEDKDESFYTLSWARDHVDGSPLLVAAGSNRIIRVINCAMEKLVKPLLSMISESEEKILGFEYFSTSVSQDVYLPEVIWPFLSSYREALIFFRSNLCQNVTSVKSSCLIYIVLVVLVVIPNESTRLRKKSMTRRRSSRKRTSREATNPVAATKDDDNSKASPLSMKKKEKQDKNEASTKEEEYPSEPNIDPLHPVVAELVPQEGLGCEVAEGSLIPTHKRLYKPCGKHTEEKHPIYGIVFNFMDARYYDIFATASINHVTTYRCLENGSFALLQAYVDEDKDESFYTVSWARDHVDGSPLLVAAGSNGIIRVINCATEKLAKSFVGHGGSIHEIKTQALKPSLIISASKDESVRLWNVHTGICILIFTGAGGHRNDVLSVDFHPSDIKCFASCGMDNTVRIWSMKEFWLYVDKSYSWTDHPSKFPTKYVQFPILVAAVHNDFVDCTRWLGDFIISKSVENEIQLWEPKPKERSQGEGSVDVLQKYPVPQCDMWFMKFSCDFHFNQLAIGVTLMLLDAKPPSFFRLHHHQSKVPIRQTALSYDGSTILAAGDDGTIWRWDEVDHPSPGNTSK
ncbi:hypothetical protein U9M48_040989 [Paspalum notatum var. saurae]|uniref:Fertilization-independent endosperm protein n=1 Tax=Paspalum notatum var. saurae TaxID=547442 RepID=A0AAQ3UM91_PASNO